MAGGHLSVVHGPEENLSRPSIDVLFRSAAVSRGNRTVGVILTGLLSDGAAGVKALVDCGGLAAVQDPEVSEYADMPANALARLSDQVATQGSTERIAAWLGEVAGSPAPPAGQVPREYELENRIALGEPLSIAGTDSIGEPTAFSCPHCDGPLWQIGADGAMRYRCHTGHAFSLGALHDGQNRKLERALWAAMRHFRDRAESARRIGRLANTDRMRDEWDGKAEESEGHAKAIQDTPLSLEGAR